jgi:ribosome-associated toxin RatA of RatAB toxin-antitoxin module
MKRIEGEASATVSASVAACFELFVAVDRYPVWGPELFREVEVLERAPDGRPATARAELHIAQSPFSKDFELVVAVAARPPNVVELTRIPNEPSDREGLEMTWKATGAAGTRIELGFEAIASFIPGFVPLPRVGDLIARTLVEAAAAALA